MGKQFLGRTFKLHLNWKLKNAEELEKISSIIWKSKNVY